MGSMTLAIVVVCAGAVVVVASFGFFIGVLVVLHKVEVERRATAEYAERLADVLRIVHRGERPQWGPCDAWQTAIDIQRANEALNKEVTT